MENLKALKVALLVTDGFEEVELTEPRKALDAAGAETRLVSPKTDRVRSWRYTEWGENLPVDRSLARMNAQDFDALLLPSGVMNRTLCGCSLRRSSSSKPFSPSTSLWP